MRGPSHAMHSMMTHVRLFHSNDRFVSVLLVSVQLSNFKVLQAIENASNMQ